MSVRRGRARSLAALFVAFAFALVVLSRAEPAGAAHDARKERVYLAQLAMVLEGTRRVVLWVETYPADVELARFAHPLAEHYVEMASRMTPPPGLVVVHPHLLLVVENVERAMDAARASDLPSFRQHVRTVREELSTLEGVLKQLKVRLPELPR